MTDPDAPRLLPGTAVVTRRDGTVQVGHPGLAFAERTAALLRALDGRTHHDQLAHRTGMTVSEVESVVRALRSAGHLEPAPIPAASVAVVGDGRLAAELAASLTNGGLSVRRQPYPVTCALPDTAGAAITVLASGRAESDRAMATVRQRADHPYLIIDGQPSSVRVGPLVLPGRSPCLRCLDLTRADADPDWPWLAPQLGRSCADPHPILRSWAVGQASSQLLAVLIGRVPLAVGGTTDLSTHDWLPHHRRWPVHPACTCLAPNR